jgi:BMFP domain-containing protein YqiC
MGRREDDMKKQKKTKDVLAETRQYVAFLEKRLASKNYKANVSAEEYQATKDKLSKARTRLKLLSPKK